jgi:hypothetical protein
MNKKSVVFSTTAVSLGLATVLTLSAVAPSMAATSHKTTKSVSSSTKSTKTGVAFSATQDARKFTTVNFKISNVPSTITDAATAAKLLVVKVVPLASDATSAPATAPVPTFGGSGDVRGGHAPDNDGGGPGANGAGGWTPGSTSDARATAPNFSGTGDARGNHAPDNDGDGPAAGFGGPRGGHGHGHGGPRVGFGGPRGMQLSNLVLSNGVLTGTIQIPGDEVANVQKWGVYLSIAADSANGITAQSATPVMVTVTTAADLTATVTATSGGIALAIK